MNKIRSLTGGTPNWDSPRASSSAFAWEAEKGFLAPETRETHATAQDKQVGTLEMEENRMLDVYKRQLGDTGRSSGGRQTGPQ